MDAFLVNELENRFLLRQLSPLMVFSCPKIRSKILLDIWATFPSSQNQFFWVAGKASYGRFWFRIDFTDAMENLSLFFSHEKSCYFCVQLAVRFLISSNILEILEGNLIVLNEISYFPLTP